MEKVIVFGDGLFGELGYFYLTYDSPHEVAGFTVDRKYMTRSELFGLPVVPFEGVELTFPPSQYKMVISIGFQIFNQLREERYLQATEKGYDLISFVSSKASTWPGLVMGSNSTIGEFSSVQPFVTIGNNVIVTSSVTIGHHAVLGDHCFVGPGAVILGGVTVEPRCLIGANATIVQSVRIARDCVIGTGAVITRDTVPGGIYVNRSPKFHTKCSSELKTRLTVGRPPSKTLWTDLTAARFLRPGFPVQGLAD